MTRSQIEYILALEQTRSFGKAANTCFVTQSTLSTMVAKFEELLGVQIFDRSTRPISLTKSGEAIIKTLRNINREYQLLDEQVNEMKGFESGKLSIACIPTVAPYLYPLILTKLTKHFPKVEFTVHELTTEHIVEELVSGNLDLGIVSTPLDNGNLMEHYLYTEDFLLYDCGNKSADKSYRVADIDLERLWLLEEGHCLRNQVGKICDLRQKKKINGNLVYSCGSIFTLIEMVNKNKGVTLLPRLAIHKNKQLIKANLHTLIEPVPSRQIGLVTHKHYLKNQIVQSLIDLIQQAVSSYLIEEEVTTDIVKPLS